MLKLLNIVYPLINCCKCVIFVLNLIGNMFFRCITRPNFLNNVFRVCLKGLFPVGKFIDVNFRELRPRIFKEL